MSDRRYRVFLALFGIAIVCVALSGWQWLSNSPAPFLKLCCPLMPMNGVQPAQGLMMLARATVIGGLSVGFVKLALRLWKTHRLIAVTMSAAMTVLPDRLTGLIEELGLRRHVVVVKTDVPVAFCFGQLRPCICISTGLADTLTHRELKAVLLHEDRHRRRYDPLRSLMADSVAVLLFFLPIAAELRDLFLTLAELDADRHAARLAGRPALAGAMLKILSHPRAADSITGIAGVSRICPTDARIAQLMGNRSPSVHLSARSLMTSSAIVMLLCVAARSLPL
ncbi:MAG: M48 family metalloprotease [Chloroflexi bacterium]|nr:M48 family metalloprotease [Chloroflexota bacterium]